MAATLVKGTKGVTDVENRITFVWKDKRDDSLIKKDIENSLRSDIRIDDGLISVVVEDGNVPLEGLVGSAAEKQQAKVNAQVANVSNVDVSLLKVDMLPRKGHILYRKYEKKSDEYIENAIKTTFSYDLRISKYGISVVVNDGEVTLQGQVERLEARVAAIQDAWNIVGVTKVNNRIKVKPTVWANDSEIEKLANQTLRQDPFTDKYQVRVRSAGGRVELHGTVDSYFEQPRAEAMVARIQGVTDIDNKLMVRNLPDHLYDVDGVAYVEGPFEKPFVDERIHTIQKLERKNDLKIKTAVENGLWWSPYVDREEVKIEVLDGKVTLSGTVDSIREKQYAAIAALKGGAYKIVNNLEVRPIPESLSGK